MFLLPITLAESNQDDNPFLKGVGEGKGDPIHKDTAELMRQLHLARTRTVKKKNPDLTIDHEREPVLLYFDIEKIWTLLETIKKEKINNHLAVCLALTLIDEDTGMPVAPQPAEIEKMKKAKDLEANNKIDDFLKEMKDLRLVQTVVLAACDKEGNIFVDTKSAFAYYDFAGQCCNIRKKVKDDKDKKTTAVALNAGEAEALDEVEEYNEAEDYTKKVNCIKSSWKLVPLA